jgi:hypothetical protein
MGRSDADLSVDLAHTSGKQAIEWTNGPEERTGAFSGLVSGRQTAAIWSRKGLSAG